MCARGPSRHAAAHTCSPQAPGSNGHSPTSPNGGPWRAWVEPEGAVREREVLALFSRKGNRPEERFKSPAEVTELEAMPNPRYFQHYAVFETLGEARSSLGLVSTF